MVYLYCSHLIYVRVYIATLIYVRVCIATLCLRACAYTASRLSEEEKAARDYAMSLPVMFKF
jgi:hypothetical protein